MATKEAGLVAGVTRGPGMNEELQRYIGRQPILNRRQLVVGYELLFRSGWENCFTGEADAATRQMLDNCLSVGVEALGGGGLVFINCTREALVGKLAMLLPPETTVLEILETVEPDVEVVKACRELRDKGYRLALDDFVLRPAMQPLVELASYVKVDFRLSDAAARREIHGFVRHSDAALLAEKIEDVAEFEMACAEGYEFFQGYFFCRPKTVTNREIPPNRMNYLLLLSEMTKQPLDLEKVIRIVRQETSMLYRLLRLANSAMCGRPTEITSVKEAFMLVGEERFRLLVSVAASCALAGNQESALVRLALERARFCELLAPLLGLNVSEQFLLGLLSLVDAMLEVSMEKIVNALPLRPGACAALLGATSPAAVPLCVVRSFETGTDAQICFERDESNISEAELTQLYLEAVKWAAESLVSSG